MNHEIITLTDLFDEFYLINDTETTSLNSPKPLPSLNNTNDFLEPKIANEPQNKFPEIPVTPKPQVIYKGANKKHITIIYNDKFYDSPENVLLITNLITKGLNISFEDVAICRVKQNDNLNLIDYFEQLTPKKVLFWGCSDLLTDAEVAYKMHEIGIFNGIHFLVADQVQMYHDNTTYKTQLWTKIKEWYNL